MNWVLIYLGIGVAVTAGALALRTWPFRGWFGTHVRLVDGIDDASLSLARRLLLKVIIPLLAGLMTTVAWPVPLVVEARFRYLMRKWEKMPSQAPFGVKRKWLRQRMTVDEIEARERVVDPLGAVPDLPFGHLHPAWRRLRDQLEPGDALWWFSARVQEWPGKTELREGYAVLRWWRVRGHVLTHCEPVKDL